MKVQLTEQQRAAMKPIADNIRQQMKTLTYMAGMIEPRVLDQTSGVRFNIDTLTFIYPHSENGDGDSS